MHEKNKIIQLIKFVRIVCGSNCDWPKLQLQSENSGKLKKKYKQFQWIMPIVYLLPFNMITHHIQNASCSFLSLELFSKQLDWSKKRKFGKFSTNIDFMVKNGHVIALPHICDKPKKWTSCAMHKIAIRIVW